MYWSGSDSSVPYPLPIDLAETHRQTMLAQLTSIIYDYPILCQDLLKKPPLRVLELGCDTGWWSATCHQFFKARGHQLQFVGMDMKPSQGMDNCFSQLGMDWEYVQHDINDFPWPVSDGEFDLVMAKNVVLALHPRKYPRIVKEYARVLKTGGILEIWEHDATVRVVKPQAQKAKETRSDLDILGLYPVMNNSTFCPATNKYAVQYNAWLTAGLSELELPVMPCSAIEGLFEGHLVDGSEYFNLIDTKRIAIPLGVKGVIWEQGEDRGRMLSTDQMAIRRTALDNFTAMVEAFEPIIKAQSGKNQTDWDIWLSKAKKDWLEGSGFASGECLELGAWSLRKK